MSHVPERIDTAAAALTAPRDAAIPRHATTRGLVYDRTLANPRPVFTTNWSIARHAEAVLVRQVYSGADGPVCHEEVHWDLAARAIRRVASDNLSLEELAQAEWTVPIARTRLAVGSRAPRTIELPLAAPPVTLTSLPLDVAAHWSALDEARPLLRAYLVLKVQRAALLRVTKANVGSTAVVRATPTNPLLRALFGTTELHFSRDGRRWLGYRGLLAPRDRRASGLLAGRWREYLGSIRWEQPVEFTEVLAP